MYDVERPWPVWEEREGDDVEGIAERRDGDGDGDGEGLAGNEGNDDDDEEDDVEGKEEDLEREGEELRGERDKEEPKSPRRREPEGPRKRFSGLRSRWATRREWQKDTASTIWRKRALVVDNEGKLVCRRSMRSPPGARSRTKKKWSGPSKECNIFTTLWWFPSLLCAWISFTLLFSTILTTAFSPLVLCSAS